MLRKWLLNGVRRWLLWGLLLTLLLASLLGLMWTGLSWYGDQAVSNREEVALVIQPGDSLGKIAAELKRAGIISYPDVFQLLARREGVATALQAGDYLIKPEWSRRQLLFALVEGRVRYYSATLVEGKTLKEVLLELNAHPKLTDPVSFSEIVGMVDTLKQGDNPEGFFYPDTYHFEAGASVRSVLEIAHERLEKVLAEEWRRRQKGLPYDSPYEALIMASIIEKETGDPSERPDIAGVFVRRMMKKIRLQTDPTVIYGLGDRYKGNLKRRMLREYTPYNTYMIKGLPPTPIALVGRKAIQAALNPAPGKALYFVARGDGTHYFSDTLREHNKAVRKYQVTERRVDYRSTVQ